MNESDFLEYFSLFFVYCACPHPMYMQTLDVCIRRHSDIDVSAQTPDGLGGFVHLEDLASLRSA